MDKPPACFKTVPESAPKPPAVLMIGNSGVGKSTLLTQLGAKGFPSGVEFRKGFTTQFKEEEIELDCQRIMLIDVPGLYEPNIKDTRLNAKKLTDALSLGYDYKLYFIMLATNRGPDDRDLVMMSRINDCIKEVEGSQVSFRLIVNQIMDERVFGMYQDELAYDNFKSFFEELKIDGFSFNIKIDHVMLLRFDVSAVAKRGFKSVLAEDVRQHSQSPIKVGELRVNNEDLKLFQSAVLALPVFVGGGLVSAAMGYGLAICAAVGGAAVVVTGGAAWMMYRTAKASKKAATK
ncbi:hypothetical protein MVEG_00084 [Podila verticillata NRRL 6337]|nr:hypothetical protein MVEG_00084 [Podila verticillata NRRL 6337]